VRVLDAMLYIRNSELLARLGFGLGKLTRGAGMQ
jgi:hypothetical protein